MSAIAFFDFDGTITKGDSFLRFLFFKRSLSAGLILKILRSLPVLAAWKLGFWNNNKAKEKIFCIFFSGMDEKKYNTNCHSFASTILPVMIKKDALEKLNWHKEQQHRVVIVSASVESYLSFFANAYMIEYIGTRIEVANGKLTGKFSGKNCYGIEKVNRIKEQYNLANYDTVYAYGDTRGDEQMLSLADKPFYREFHG